MLPHYNPKSDNLLTKNTNKMLDAKKSSFLEFFVNQAFSASLLAMIHENRRFLLTC
jgi:hypothetical protein